MPPARKPRFHEKAKKPKKQFVPDSEDDYLYIGSVEEEHGDRWLNNDPEKALRFYQVALQYYGTCLGRYPDSFDAGYNRCRLEFHIFQSFYSRLALTTTTDVDKNVLNAKRQDRVQVLTKILQDHEEARALAPMGHVPSDLLFNMGQVQLSLAEEQFEHTAYLTALELFDQTWSAQLNELLDFNRAGQGDGSDLTETSTTDESVQYETAIEATTATSLLETAAAGLSCLIPIYTVHMVLAPVAVRTGIADDVLQHMQAKGMELMQRIATLLSFRILLGLSNSENQIHDAALLVMRYVAISGFPFGSGVGGNLDRLKTIWSTTPASASVTSDSSSDLYGLDTVIPLVEINVGVEFSTENFIPTTTRTILELVPTSCSRYLAQADMFTQFGLLSTASRTLDVDVSNAWAALSLASQYLSQALSSLLSRPTQQALVVGSNSTIHSRLEQARIWITRGDVDLLRGNLAPLSLPASTNLRVLRKNAEIYYRNAVKIASDGQSGSKDAELIDVANEAKIKCALVLDDQDQVRTIPRYKEILAEAVDDGLISPERANQFTQ
ncbi:uncharacterized protein V1516DRAFT_102676 [Lipomyces oligophaga]|uniref:uncharacterized protein n=1 Tax=Lipomyces oligophaga TaxID=45792 RepID=UPI0034CDAE1B